MARYYVQQTNFELKEFQWLEMEPTLNDDGTLSGVKWTSDPKKRHPFANRHLADTISGWIAHTICVRDGEDPPDEEPQDLNQVAEAMAQRNRQLQIEARKPPEKPPHERALPNPPVTPAKNVPAQVKPEPQPSGPARERQGT